MKHCALSMPRLFAHGTVLLGVATLAFACKGSRSPNSTNAAPPLEEFNPAGQYVPYYITGDMNDPRYLHQVIRLKNGLILVTGGTDERGFSAFDTVELFDETSIRKGELRPPSLTGQWIDTDFEGNPIVMEFRRFWHAMTLLPDGKVLVTGGIPNWIRGRPPEKVEAFDTDTRQFETLKDAALLTPRFRHTANPQPDGTIVVAGGQIHDLFIDIQTFTQTGGGFGGQVQVQSQTDIFPSTPRVEVFNFRDLLFTQLTLSDSSRPSQLSSSRGRAGHVAIPFAGFDNLNSTGDDLLLLCGGFQTPSQGLLAPIISAARRQPVINLRSVEVYDPTLHLFSQIGSGALNAPRLNDPQATNLGIYNDFTPDGVIGMGNVILICGGDDNGGGGPCFNTPFIDEVFVATFTGFGPASGLIFQRIQYTDPINNGHIQGMEAGESLRQPLPPPQVGLGPPVPEFFIPPGRSMAPIVALPRTVEARPGVSVISTWVYTGGGVASICDPPACPPCTYYAGTIASGAIFDPLYRLINENEFLLTPIPNARDLTVTRDPNVNPTGVMGTWLALDGKYPSINRVGWGDVPMGQWASHHIPRVYHQHIALAGQDGIFDTVDDRVLQTGGGDDGVDLGGEASEPSAETMLMPLSPP